DTYLRNEINMYDSLRLVDVKYDNAKRYMNVNEKYNSDKDDEKTPSAFQSSNLRLLLRSNKYLYHSILLKISSVLLRNYLFATQFHCVLLLFRTET
ncbi:40677_t:CDS:2, partial [Gigaspora margarita]